MQTEMNRREFAQSLGAGFGAVALTDLLANSCAFADEPKLELNGGVHHPAKVKRVIQLFMNGGASQMDLVRLQARALFQKAGEKFDPGDGATRRSRNQCARSHVLKPPFEFHQHGECGRWVSRSNAASGEACRRDGLSDGDAVADERPRAGKLSHEHRLPAAGLSVSGGVGQLRPRKLDRQPTHVRRPAGCSRAAVQQQGELRLGVSAGVSSGDDRQHGGGRTDCRSEGSRIGEVHHFRGRSRGVGPAPEVEPRASLRERQRLTAGGPHQVV